MWSGLAALVVAIASASAFCDPESDRKYFLDLYNKKFPSIALDDYVHGAMIFSADAKAQYDSIMELPPFASVLDKGKTMWEKPFANGRSFADCFPNGGRNVAGNYPLYDDQLSKVITFEMAVNRCLRDNAEPELVISDMKTMGVLMAYARSLSDGMKMNIKVASSGAREKFEAGKRFFFSRRGQLNFACASCHMENAGNTLRTEILSPTVGQATHWPVFRGGDNLNTIQARYKRCLEQIRAVPLELGGEEFNNLEYFHSYLSNGLPLTASVYRK